MDKKGARSFLGLYNAALVVVCILAVLPVAVSAAGEPPQAQGTQAAAPDTPSAASTSTSINVSVVVERPTGVGAVVTPQSDDPDVSFSTDVVYLGPVNPETTPTAEASFQVRLSGVGYFTERVSWTDFVGVPGTEAEGYTLPSDRLRVYRKIGPPAPIWTEIPNGWTNELQLSGELRQHFKAVFAADWEDIGGQYAGSLDVSFEQR